MTRYELLDRIGVGGMAEIFRGKAVAAGGFEKPVAIKRILPHLSQDRRFVELLIAEAKVLSLLKHRNIVQIFDVGLGDDGQYFLVMEYVDGKDLRAVQAGLEARRRGLPFDLALHIGAEICEALEHAHSARAPDGKPMSLVHRDVSPSNVLLSRAGEVKLTDFGIAKRAEQETTHGAVRGKFAYISPEQARNGQVEPRSDVFSVGILLWELICNRRLFSGLGDLEALRAVRDAHVTPPTELDDRLPPELDPLLMAALDPDPEQRPTAGQLGAKLRALRYSLEVTVGDPAAELARVIDTADEVQRQSEVLAAPRARSAVFDSVGDHTEATVIRIRTADDFALRDKDGASVARAREVIDRFEEEETRLAQLSGEQLRTLRSGGDTDDGDRDSGVMAPPALPGMPRARRSTDEPTVARPPLDPDRLLDDYAPRTSTVPHAHLDADESTRLVAPRDRRTPVPGTPTPQPPSPLPMPPSPPVMPSHGPPHGAASRGAPGATAGEAPRGPAPITQPPPLAPPPVPLPPVATLMMTPAPVPIPGARPGGPPSPAGPPPGPPPPGPRSSGPPPGLPPPYPGWGVQPQLPPRMASPTAPDLYERPVYPRGPSAPQVAGFGPPRGNPLALRPWMIVVGALLMALLAFAITRAFLS